MPRRDWIRSCFWREFCFASSLQARANLNLGLDVAQSRENLARDPRNWRDVEGLARDTRFSNGRINNIFNVCVTTNLFVRDS